jgi:hypothetical protein
LAEGLISRNIKVDLVLTRLTGEYLKDIPEGVRVINLNTRRIITSILPLVRYLKKEQPQILLSALKPTNCVALWASRLSRTNVPIIVAEHNTLSQSSANPINRRAAWLPFWMRKTYPWADSIIAVSVGVADDLASTIGLPRDRIKVIYNPVVTPELLDRSNEALVHPWFGEDQPPVILGVVA